MPRQTAADRAAVARMRDEQIGAAVERVREGMRMGETRKAGPHRVPKRDDQVIYHGRDGDVRAVVIAADREQTALIGNDDRLGRGRYTLTARHGTNVHQWRWPDPKSVDDQVVMTRKAGDA